MKDERDNFGPIRVIIHGEYEEKKLQRQKEERRRLTQGITAGEYEAMILRRAEQNGGVHVRGYPVGNERENISLSICRREHVQAKFGEDYD